MENKLAQLEDRVDEVKNLTAVAANKSSAVSQEAIDLLILDLTLPLVDIDELWQQVERVSNEVNYDIALLQFIYVIQYFTYLIFTYLILTYFILSLGMNYLINLHNLLKQGVGIKEEAQLLLKENEQFMNEMIEKVRMSYDLLERAQDQQAATAELLAELDQANETANDAVNRGDQTLKEAQETLKKLGGKFFEKNTIYEAVKKNYAVKNIRNIEVKKKVKYETIFRIRRRGATRAREGAGRLEGYREYQRTDRDRQHARGRGRESAERVGRQRKECA